MIACQELSRDVGAAAAFKSLDIARPTYYRRLGARDDQASSRPAPPRALSVAERQGILDVLHSDRFLDKAPTEVYTTLLDEGTYHCSIRTMYRVLEEAGEVRERRDQVRHPHYKAPELLATAPNQVWSCDITKLLGPAKWAYFYLYVILDIFSRYVVGWMIAHQESSALAKRLIAETCEKQTIQAGQLTVHADRGASMKSKPVALLLSDLGITKTHSRPHVSDDNPFSESQFKTLKYRPGFPDRFGSIQDARAFCQDFFSWYNTEHRHTGIGLLTPGMVHYGKAEAVIGQRRIVLSAAFDAHPERFVRGLPVPPPLPEAAWINKPKIESDHVAPVEKAAIRGVSGGGHLTFGVVARALHAINPENITKPDYIRPMTTIPFFTNIYTYLDSLFLEYGWIGVFVYPFLLGLALSYLYLSLHDRPGVIKAFVNAMLGTAIVQSLSGNRFGASGVWMWMGVLFATQCIIAVCCSFWDRMGKGFAGTPGSGAQRRRADGVTSDTIRVDMQG